MASSSASATVAVDKATSDLLLGPDWTTNMEICDSVNSLHWYISLLFWCWNSGFDSSFIRFDFVSNC